MPFAGYSSFDDCVRQNRDKGNAEAFCAWLHRKTTGRWPSEKGSDVKTTIKDAAAVGSADWVRFQAELALNGPDSEYPYAYVREVFNDRVIAEAGFANLIEIPYAVNAESAELTLDIDAAKPVKLEYTSKANSPVLTGPIFATKADDDQRLAYAAVLVPGEPDSDGDVVSAAKIEEVAHHWMENYRQIDLMHTLSPADAVVVESYVTPADMTVGEYDLPAGTWVMASRINSDDVWSAVKDGVLTGYSIMGVRKAALQMAMKGEAALKRTLLSDLGDDWICPFVSIVDAPAVPKAKFFALKSEQSEPQDKTLLSKLSKLLGTSPKEPDVATFKAGRKFSDKTYSRMKDALTALAELVEEAEKEREEKSADKTVAKGAEMTPEEIKDAMSEALKPLMERLDALETAKPTEAEAEAEAEKSAETTEDVEELKQQVATLTATLTEVEKRLKPVTKSRVLRGDDEEPAAAEKGADEAHARDVFGRARRKPHSLTTV